MILRRYISNELLTATAATAGIVLFVMLIGSSFQIFRQYSGLGLEFVVAGLVPALGYIAPYSILVAAAVGPALAYARFSGDLEIDAMRTHGFTTSRILLPAFTLGLLLTNVSYLLNEFASPTAHYQYRKILRESLIALLRNPPPGPNVLQLGSKRLFYRDASGHKLIEPMLWNTGADGTLEGVYTAREGRVIIEENAAPGIELICPNFEQRSGDRLTRGDFGTLYHALDVEDFEKREKREMDMSSRELLDFIRRRHTDSRRIVRARVEYYDRLGRSAAPLLITLLGAIAGMLTRKSSRLAGFGAALPVLAGYFLLWVFFHGLGDKERIGATLAAAIPPGVLMLLLIPLLWRVFRR